LLAQNLLAVSTLPFSTKSYNDNNPKLHYDCVNGSLKTGFTTNRFHLVSGYLENGPNRFETGQIFPKRAEKNPGSTRIEIVFLPVYK
jgi:hypothetical protein